MFDIRKEENFCLFCVNFCCGIFNFIVKSLGCNKVVFGYYLDDVVEIFFLSLFFEGRIYCFLLKIYFDRI